MKTIISAPVGKGGVNIDGDVRLVQRLLNDARARSAQAPMLIVDGIVGPKTIAAITDFQRRHSGVADGRVDTNGPTIRALLDEHLASLGGALDVSRLGGFVNAVGVKASSTDPGLQALIAGYVDALRQR